MNGSVKGEKSLGTRRERERKGEGSRCSIVKGRDSIRPVEKADEDSLGLIGRRRL